MTIRGLRSWITSLAALAALAVPVGVAALGLGEARVESYLNQPLDVRMRLLDATADDLDSLTVRPASPEDFERLGLMSGALALDLDVRIDRTERPPVIRITSDRPVTDPVLQLLIDARWSSGRVLREYTLFLDPPTVEMAAPPPAPAEPQRQQDTAATPAETAPRPGPDARPTAPARETSRPVAAGGRYGPVSSGDTLWSIASANRPAGDVTMDQMMIAIVELNPGAFRDRNINRLLRGAELEMPTAEQARALDPAEAAALVAAQNRAFRRGTTGAPPVVSDAGRAGDADRAEEADADAPSSGDAAADAAGESPGAEPRLSLVPPGDEAGGAGQGDDPEAEMESLRQQLARAEEELYAARQEAEEFRSRVSELERLVRENPNGVGIRDAELAGLEETLRAAREATAADADPEMRAEVSERLGEYLEQYEAAAEASPGAEATMTESDAATVSDVDADDAAPADEADAEPAQAEEPAAQPEPERRVTEVGGGDSMWSNPMTLLLIGLVVLLIVVAVLRLALRSRRQQVESAPPALKRSAETPSKEPEAAPANPSERARERVATAPADLAAHLALLKTLANEGQEQEFGAALEAMFRHVDSGAEPEWRDAVELAGRVVPGHPLVKGSADWVVGDEDVERASAAPPSELDQEAEVDDLMSRLDDELEEGDDEDWLDEDDEDAGPDQGPFLREDTDAHDRERPTAWEGGADTEDEAVDLGRGEPDEERPETRAEEPAAGDSGREDEDLMLDWPDFDQDEADDRTESSATETEAGGVQPLVDEEDETEDIFSQTDDDIDVKLDLARAYLSWNSTDSARTLLEEVVREGNESQQAEARKLLEGLAGDSEG